MNPIDWVCESLCCGDTKQSEFDRLSKTRLTKRGRSCDTSDANKLKRRHAGVIGLSACILAFPYQVPDFMPSILMTLSTHLDDPQPIQVCDTLLTYGLTSATEQVAVV